MRRDRNADGRDMYSYLFCRYAAVSPFSPCCRKHPRRKKREEEEEEKERKSYQNIPSTDPPTATAFGENGMVNIEQRCGAGMLRDSNELQRPPHQQSSRSGRITTTTSKLDDVLGVSLASSSSRQTHSTRPAVLIER